MEKNMKKTPDFIMNENTFNKIQQQLQENIEEKCCGGILRSPLDGLRIDIEPMVPDNTYIDYEKLVDKMTLSMGIPRNFCYEGFHYDCPFSFLLEFDKWFEWQKRVHFDGQSTATATGEMKNWDPEYMSAFSKMRAIFSENQYATLFRPSISMTSVCV